MNPLAVLTVLREACDALVECAYRQTDWDRIERLDAAIEMVAATQESHTETLGELIAANRGAMQLHPVCQEGGE